MFQRITDYLIGGALLAALVFFLYGKVNASRLDSTQQSERHYAGNAKAHEVAAVEYRTIIEQKEKAHVDVERAIESNRAWADEPLPRDVADLLRHDSGSSRAVP